MFGKSLWDAVKRLISVNAVIKWGVIVLVGLFAVQFLSERAVDLWVKVVTAQSTADKIKANAAKEQAASGAVTQKPIRFCKLDNPPCPD